MSKGYRIPRSAVIHILRLCESDLLDSDDCVRGNAVTDIRLIMNSLKRLDNLCSTIQVQEDLDLEFEKILADNINDLYLE